MDFIRRMYDSEDMIKFFLSQLRYYIYYNGSLYLENIVGNRNSL